MNIQRRKNMDQKVLDLLYRSFDGQLTPEEKQLLEKTLAQSKALQKEKERIVGLRKTISGSALQSFEPFFAERLMQRIQAERESQSAAGEDFIGSLLWSFRRIALAGAIAVLLLLTSNIVQKGEISLNSMLAIPQLTIEDTLVLNNPLEGELK
jgi:anti-sigma factor RsiW